MLNVSSFNTDIADEHAAARWQSRWLEPTLRDVHSELAVHIQHLRLQHTTPTSPFGAVRSLHEENRLRMQQQNIFTFELNLWDCYPRDA